MQIITTESLTDNFVKNILSELYSEYQNDKKAHDDAMSFDEWVYERTSELGLITYQLIGEHYGDLDSAIELMK